MKVAGDTHQVAPLKVKAIDTKLDWRENNNQKFHQTGQTGTQDREVHFRETLLGHEGKLTNNITTSVDFVAVAADV